MKTREKFRVVGGIRYGLIEPSVVREHILSMADQEWDPEDFARSGKDLRNATWKLEKVKVQSVRMHTELMRSREFRNDLRLRIGRVLKLIKRGGSIPPLVLRGKDLLIFDGYAGLHALRQLGATECLAYIWHRSPMREPDERCGA